jgi:hypothetical protein
LIGKLSDVTLCEAENLELDFGQIQISGNVKSYLFQKKTSDGWETIIETQEPQVRLENSKSNLEGTYRLRIEFVSEINSICPRNTNEFDLKIQPKFASVSFGENLTLCENSALRTLEGSENLIFFNQSRVEIENTSELNSDYLLFKKNIKSSCTNSLDSVLVNKISNPVPRLATNQFYSCIGNDFDLSELDRLGSISWFSKSKKLTESPIINVGQVGVQNYGVTIKNEQGCESKRFDLEFITELCISDQPTNCGSSNSLNLKENEWNYLTDQSGLLLMAIHPQGQLIENFNYSYQITKEAKGIKSENETIYLPRYFHLSSSNELGKSVRLRFYFDSDEINEHLDIVPNLEQNNGLFSLVQYNGLNEDCQLSNNQNLQGGKAIVYNETIEPILQGSGSAYFEVNLASFGEIGFTANRFHTLGDFNVKEENGTVLLSIAEGEGVRTATYRIEKKTGNGVWVSLGEGLQLTDEFLINGENIYRAIHIDRDGVEKVVGLKDIFLRNREPKCFTFPNVTKSLNGLSLFLANIEPIEISITDIKGQEFPIVLVPENEYFSRIELPLEVLEGQYVLRIIGKNDQECTWKIIKQP